MSSSLLIPDQACCPGPQGCTGVPKNCGYECAKLVPSFYSKCVRPSLSPLVSLCVGGSTAVVLSPITAAQIECELQVQKHDQKLAWHPSATSVQGVVHHVLQVPGTLADPCHCAGAMHDEQWPAMCHADQVAASGGRGASNACSACQCLLMCFVRWTDRLSRHRQANQTRKLQQQSMSLRTEAEVRSRNALIT